jgi:hypothetical protein
MTAAQKLACCKALVGLRVRNTRVLTTRGGRRFEVGLVWRVTSTWRGRFALTGVNRLGDPELAPDKCLVRYIRARTLGVSAPGSPGFGLAGLGRQEGVRMLEFDYEAADARQQAELRGEELPQKRESIPLTDRLALARLAIADAISQETTMKTNHVALEDVIALLDEELTIELKLKVAAREVIDEMFTPFGRVDRCARVLVRLDLDRLDDEGNPSGFESEVRMYEGCFDAGLGADPSAVELENAKKAFATELSRCIREAVTRDVTALLCDARKRMRAGAHAASATERDR